MIKKYNQYIKESLLDKLQGPTKEEMWKNIGFDETFDTPEEYLDTLFKDTIHYEMSGNQVWWERNNKVILLVDYSIKHLSIHERLIYNVLKHIFELSDTEMMRILNSFKKIKSSPEFRFFVLDSYGDEDEDEYDD